MEGELLTAGPVRAAALEHLTGPSRGGVTWLGGSTLEILLSPEGYIRAVEAREGETPGNLIARLHPEAGGYEWEAPEGQPVWVNGSNVSVRRLEHRDMIEFGDAGPLSRYRQFGDGQQVSKSVIDILSDCSAYMNCSRQPLSKRLFRMITQLLRRLTQETTILFRAGTIAALAILVVLFYQQQRSHVALEQRVESGSARLDSFSKALARARENALTPGDLTALKQELRGRLSSTAERLQALKKRSRAAGTVIAQALPSVAFIQGAYGFRERESGRPMRHVLDPLGRPLMSPMGTPLLTLEGGGPVAERHYTGTGFLFGEAGALVTNRHVALPWEGDANIETLASQGLDPVMVKLIAYFPGSSAAIAVELARASDDADLAVLRAKGSAGPMPGLQLAETAPKPGDEVIVMGYPTGLRSMLAQSGDTFVEELQKADDTGFWSVAGRLAKAGHIQPLASRGIVGQATAAAVVYDAETTHGGSGGPVLDINGAVVAVNAAILPEYGGSNLGVPIAKVRALLATAGLN